MRHALIDGTNTVVNVVIVDPAELARVGGWRPPAGQVAVATLTGDIGNAWDGSNFTKLAGPTLTPLKVPA